MRALALAAALLTLAVAGAGPALGTLPPVARDVSRPTLQVDAKGYALVTFTESGKQKRVLYWGAVNAVPPQPAGRPTEFRIDYSGGWKALKQADYFKTIKNVCSSARYDGPAIPFKVVACKAADGTYWALQSWQRMLPNLGFAPWRPEQSVAELHLAHWSGPLPELKASMNWAWGGRYEQLVGTYTYDGSPVHGFKASPSGVPLDAWGRNIYLDTLDSPYGAGWKRENSFLAQGRNGRFCYSFSPRPPYPGYPASPPRQGNGKRYRLAALGPGVTPIVAVELPAAGPWDPNDPAKAKAEEDGNALVGQLGFTSAQCHL